MASSSGMRAPPLPLVAHKSSLPADLLGSQAGWLGKRERATLRAHQPGAKPVRQRRAAKLATGEASIAPVEIANQKRAANGGAPPLFASGRAQVGEGAKLR